MPTCRNCGKQTEYTPYYCEACYAYRNPKQYCRKLTYEKYGKALYCKVCRMMGGVQWHHHDYTKPYDVVAPCKECHKIADEHRDKTEDHKLGDY